MGAVPEAFCRRKMSILFLGFQGRFLSPDLKPSFPGLDTFKAFPSPLITLFIYLWSEGDPCPQTEHQWRGGWGRGTRSTSKLGSQYSALAEDPCSIVLEHPVPRLGTDAPVPDTAVHMRNGSYPHSSQKPLKRTGIHWWGVWWVSSRCSHGVNHSAPNGPPTPYYNKVSLSRMLWPTVSHPPFGKFGYMEPLFCADSIRSYGRLLSGEEADGADGDTEQKPKSRHHGWTSLAQGEGRRRKQNLALLVFTSLFIPAVEATVFSFTSSPRKVWPECQETLLSVNAGQSRHILPPLGLPAYKQDCLQTDNLGEV